MADEELTAEMIVDGRAPHSVAVSPDGTRIAYVVGPDLWTVTVDGGTGPRRVTAGDTPRWSPDSRLVYFLVDDHLHRVSPDDGRVEKLTAQPVTGHLPLEDLVVLIGPDDPPDDDIRVWPGSDRPHRLRLLDLRTREIRTVPGDRHVVEVARRPDGGPLAVLTWSTPAHDVGPLEAGLHLLDPHTGDRRDLGPAAVDASSPTWWRADDGWHLAYLATTPPHLVGGTAVLDIAVSGAVKEEHRNLTAGMTVCPTHLAQVDDGPPLMLVADGLDSAIYRLSTEVLHLRGLARELVTDRSGTRVATVLSGSNQPGDVYAGPTHGPLARRTDVRPDLRDVRWCDQERLSYKAADGLALDGLLIQPGGTGPFPLVTIVHGGPYDRYADKLNVGWFPSGQWLAAAGFAVFLPNARGGKGHGHEFAVKVAGAVGQEEWTDVETGIDLLVERGVADPGRLGIAGWSHGGFMAAWAVGQTDRFRAAVMGAGISDWGMLAATGEWGPFEAALGGSTGWEGIGPHPHDRLSPVSYASKVRTPVLILHGENDTNVPLSQAEYYHRALRRFGVEHEYVVYPREGHSIGERAHQLDVLHRTRAWFGRWLTDTSV